MTLDTSARFWNGDHVTASAVLAAWSAAPTGERARLVAAATRVIDDRTLSVTLSDSTPHTFADPGLAVHRARSESQWREGTGTGRYQIDSRDSASASGITLSPEPNRTASRVRVRSIDAAAARDVLDAGADLLVSDDPAIVSYAAYNDELLTLQLPWDRTYVVLVSESALPNADETLRPTLVESLADAVRTDHRVAQQPFWWESSNHCAAPAETRPVAPVRSSSRVVYRSDDRVAEGITERLVALASSRSAGDSVLGTLLPGLSRARGRATAAALSPAAFAAALHAGDDVAYVLALPSFTAAPCHELAMLLRDAPWLDAARTPGGPAAIPLVDTRSVAIVRRGRLGLSVDAAGSLRLLDGTAAKNGQR